METSKNNLLNLWKKDIHWNEMSKTERKNIIAYGVCCVTFLATIGTWMMLPTLMAAVYCHCKVSDIDIHE